MLEIVRAHLTVEGIRCALIRGDVTPKKRADIVDAFNDDPRGPEVGLEAALN